MDFPRRRRGQSGGFTSSSSPNPNNQSENQPLYSSPFSQRQSIDNTLRKSDNSRGRRDNRGGLACSSSPTPNHQRGNQPLNSPHFSRKQSIDNTLKASCNQDRSQPLFSALFSQKQENTKALRPLPPRPPGSKQCSKLGLHYSGHLTNKIKKVETNEEKKIRLESELKKYETPFNWKPRQPKPLNEPETIIRRMQEKDKEVKDHRKFKWLNFIYHLVICYEQWRAENLSQAIEEICGLEAELLKKSNRDDWMFICIEDALFHVVTASKAFLYLQQDRVSEADQLIQRVSLLHYDMMKRQSRAGIHGIRAAMFMEYGHRGNKNALDEARKAAEIDRSNPEWFYFISKCMGRIRRVAQCHDHVSAEEVKAINKAVKDDERNASYTVLLAQVLSERAFRQYTTHKPERGSDKYNWIWRNNLAAMHRFEKAVELGPNSPHILIRCARGLMKLPPRLKNLKFIKDCIEKAVELAPNNPMVHHVKAMYHERFDCEAELPLEAYEKAASLDNFGAAMDLVRLHHRLKVGDIIGELEMLASKFGQVDKLQVVYTQAGSYLLFIEKDIVGALKYYLKVMEIDPNSYAMKAHKPIFIRVKDPINMFDVMLEELASKTLMNTFSLEERKIFKAFLVGASEHQPLRTEDKKRPTVEEILELSRSLVERDSMYKVQAARGRKRRQKRISKSGKKWCGKNKAKKKDNEVKSKVSQKQENKDKQVKSNNSKKPRLEREKTERRDVSVSSNNSVDSDYYRDSTIHGPRGFFLNDSNVRLNNTKTEKIDSQQNHSVYLTRESRVPEKYYGNSSQSSRDSSLSSMFSACSISDSERIRGGNFSHLSSNTTRESKLTVENMKKFDFENSYNTGVQRLSMLSLSSADSGSQASSVDTVSVMDRVRQSYAMLGRESKPKHGKNPHFRKYGSTQSLNTQNPADQKKHSGNKNDPKSGSSQSVNVLDNKFSKLSISSIDSSRSFSFMPDFARKNSQSDINK